MMKICNDILNIVKESGVAPFLVAIDGRCAAGKTTLAEYISSRTNCTLFHMDDYFLRQEMRTVERLDEPGGNTDHERFEAEVLLPVKNGVDRVRISRYDCSRGELSDPATVFLTDLIIVEGSYSCHPSLWDYYDLHVFLDVSKDEQKRRIIDRNGLEGYAVFRDRWIPLEEKYFEAFRIRERCDFLSSK